VWHRKYNPTTGTGTKVKIWVIVIYRVATGPSYLFSRTFYVVLVLNYSNNQRVTVP